MNAIRGFLERLGRLIAQRRPRHLAVADDEAWRPDWRVELIPTYKSHRVAEPVPAGLEPQLPVIRELLAAIGIDMVGVADHEAEDVIATWCRLAPGHDRDRQRRPRPVRARSRMPRVWSCIRRRRAWP